MIPLREGDHVRRRNDPSGQVGTIKRIARSLLGEAMYYVEWGHPHWGKTGWLLSRDLVPWPAIDTTAESQVA